MLYLIKLKNLLRYNGITILVIFLTFIFVYINISKKTIFEQKNNYTFVGIIESIKITEKKLELQVKGNNTIIVNYYFKNTDKSIELSNLKIGYKIEVNGIIKESNTNTNFNTFNYRNYLLSKKIKYIMTVESNKIKIINKNQNVFYYLKHKIISYLKGKNNSDYLYSFLIGDTSNIDTNIKKSYITNGISHLFSVSGMHVGFLSSVVLIFLDKISKHKNINQLILVFILIFYAFLAGFSPSIMRTITFMILLYFKKKLNLSVSTFKLYCLMTCGFLVYNPFYIYNSGFLYSFIISGFLIYFSYLLKNKNYFFKLFLISFIAFLSSFPISLLNNYELNFFSVFLNLIFVPFVSFIIFPLSFIVIFLPFVMPLFSILIVLLENISIFFSNNLTLNIIFGKPSFIMIFLYYIVVFIILKNIKNSLGYILLLILLFINYNKLFFSQSRLTILDVGQGDCSFLSIAKKNINILIDTGGVLSDNYSISNSTIIPYLKSFGIRKLDYLIITHGDYDHMGEAINLVENFKVEKVIFNNGEYNDLELELIKVLEKKNIPYYQNIKELNIGENNLYFLNNKVYDNENDNSIVLYTKINNHKVLLMGDAGIEVEQGIIQKYNLSDVDILKVGHHGSKTSSSEEFIDYIEPKNSIISVGKNNRYGHPNNEVLNILDNSNIYRTDKDGSIMFKFKKDKLEVSTCPP